MRISDTLKKAAGLFVEFDSSQTGTAQSSVSDEEFRKMRLAQGGSAAPATAPAAKTVEQIVKDSPGPNLDEIKIAAATPQVQPMGEDGKIDHKAIYTMANVQDAPFTAEQLLDLLATLPAELPL